VRVLIRSSRLTDVRRSALVALVGDLAGVEVSDTAAPLPDPTGFDGVVVDGPQPHSDAAALAAWVGRGGLLVALGAAPTSPGPWADLVGAVAEPALARGEWFGKNVAAASPLTARLDPEFPVVDRFEPLRPLGAAETIVAVSIRFADHAAIVRQQIGDGWVLTSGLGSTNEALACAPLAAIVRRALRAEPVHDTRTIGIGIVGYGPFGGMGYYHGLGARSTPGLELVAASDPSDERRKAAETDFAGVSTYASADDLAGDGDVDVVFIATPPAYHADLAMRMLRAGKHVACEKPLCLTAAEADALIATAAEHDRVLTVHQNRRWDVDFLAVRRAVDAGALGEVFNVETFVGGYEHPCRAWHSEVSVSGGAVYDWGSHHIDWILQLLGSPPAVVQTHGHKRVWHDVTNLDQLRVRLTWADGREAEFFQSDVAAVRRPKFYVQGTAGTLVGHYRPVTFERIEAGRGYVAETAHHAEAPAELHLASYESGYGVSETRLALAPEQRFAFHRNLADHLLLGEPLAVTPASVRDVIAVLEAAQRSSDEGNVAVALP
jgi:predicted dehydrogenase